MADCVSILVHEAPTGGDGTDDGTNGDGTNGNGTDTGGDDETGEGSFSKFIKHPVTIGVGALGVGLALSEKRKRGN